ncbi:galactoside 3(4)-L-fucosyltransferase-like [Galendromus occidentalis]|uniref:Fucosyltransferase n=1 Tax=Galendromus occidentalis TaxID=34638 RepID=A0AAJ6QVF3_9ACAR|nr:galactoside 3(4)-L-fucosyltransferase-like [Galendromus occidentalis]
MTQNESRGGFLTKQNLLGLLPFAFVIAFLITCVITYPELIPHSKSFHFDELPFCDNEIFPKRTQGNFSVLLWTRKSVNIDLSALDPKSCEYQNCFFSSDREQLNASDAVVFNDSDLEADDLPASRLDNQRWVFYSREAPPTSKLTSAYNGIFNWTMSYSKKDDVHVPFFEMCREVYRPPRRNVSEKRFAAVWFVDECSPSSLPYVHLLQTEFPVHIVGPCSPQGFHCTRRRSCMEKILPLYKFVLVFEDSICSDFVTERLLEVLRYDVIPIVSSGADYSAILPKESFVVASEHGSPKELARMLFRFRNDALFQKAINARRGVHATRVDWKCRLCEKLNSHSKQTGSHAKLAEDRLKRGRCKVWRRNFFRTYKASTDMRSGGH